MTPPESLRDPQPNRETLIAWETHLGQPVKDPAALRGRLSSGPTLMAAFDQVAQSRADFPALTVGGNTLTHGEVRRLSRGAGAGLRRRGVTAGTRVTILADVDLDVVIAYLGALRVGAVVSFADPSYTSSELLRVLAVSHAEIVLGTGSSLARVMDSAADQPIVGLKESDRDMVGEAILDLRKDDVAPDTSDPNGVAILAFTSGSTGDPKLVPLTHRNLLASIRGASTAWRWSASDRLIHSLPIGHQHGLGGIHMALVTGSHTVMLPRFDSQLLIDTVRAHVATALFAVPTIYERLLDLVPSDLDVLQRLRLMISGSSPLPAATATRIQEVSGQLPIERYGTTESGLNVSNPYDGRRIPGTVGLPLPGVELAVVGPTDERVGVGEIGEVVVRGPQIFRGYVDGDTGRVFTGDWFRTGDRGVIDEVSGHLSLVGRTKDLIITGGLNVVPREVETALLAVPGVRDAAVIGTPSAMWGEAVTAFVVTDGLSPSQIATALAETLAPFKRPKQIIEVAVIPRTAIGKTRRDLLAASPELDTS